MKALVFIILMMPFLGISQAWRDSLDVARTAYKNENFDKAFRYYKSAQSQAPESIDLSDEIGQSAYKSQQYDVAEKVYQQTGSESTDKKAKAAKYHNLGNSRMQKKDYPAAIEAYKDALRNNPNDAETRYNLSEAIRELKNLQNQQQQQKQDQNENQNNESQPNKEQQQNQSQDQNNQSDSQSDKKQSGQNDKQQNKSGGNSPILKDKNVEKKLDELMKQEAETKRRLSGTKSESSSSKSGKDW